MASTGWLFSGSQEGTQIENPRLTREQVVDRIITLNPTASQDFLREFRDDALALYLEHLTATQEPRGRNACWRRPGDSPSILERRTRTW